MCIDVDECRESNPCAQFCENSEGHYQCGCAEGYRLAEDQTSCLADGMYDGKVSRMGGSLNFCWGGRKVLIIAKVGQAFYSRRMKKSMIL